MNSEGLPSQALKRKKTRRLKKRRLQDLKSTEIHEVPLKKGKKQPAAPENTTQFIIDDREPFDLDFNLCSPTTASPSSYSCSNSTSSVRGSPLDEKDFDYFSDIEENFDQDYFEKDFNDVYDNIHAETLFSLTKQELISRYLNLEKREEELLKTIRSMSCEENMETSFVDLLATNNSKIVSSSNENACQSTENSLATQRDDLRNTNLQLAQENERLRAS